MHIPTATYRILFNKEFTFKHLAGIIDYLHNLGISTIYASPITNAVPGSMHGYDVIDPHSINPEIGTLEELKTLAQLLKEKGMGWIQDIVPNHMAFDTGNYRLMDVLERGPVSAYYRYFDIQWNHHDPELTGKLMIPVLDNDVETCLREDKIQLEFTTQEGFVIQYAGNNYPLSASAYPVIITNCQPANHFTRQLVMCANQSNAETHKKWTHTKQNFLQGVQEDKGLINLCVLRINQNKNTLRQLLRDQYYVFTPYTETSSKINYRRFLTIDNLVCLDMGPGENFMEYHSWLHTLYQDGLIQGLRIAHLDGLSNPGEYLQRLRSLFGEDCFIIVEKILEAKEQLPQHWPIQGTSGYEFLAQVSQLLTQQEGAKELVRQYKEIDRQPYCNLLHEKKKLVLQQYMAGELDNLLHYFFEMAPAGTRIDKGRFKKALATFMICLPVYRIYPEQLPLDETETKIIASTLYHAQQKDNTLDDELLLLKKLFEATDELLLPQHKVAFIKRLMQFTGPLTAKGVEDTTFYVYNAFIAHNEVGDSAAVPGITVNSFHNQMLGRQQFFPLSLNATATHDTGRGEEARLRIMVLSALHQQWKQLVEEWQNLNAPISFRLPNGRSPTLNDEYFLYQSLVGGFPQNFEVTPEYKERLNNYFIKVVRESKVNSSWNDPYEEYETACFHFINELLNEEHSFLATFVPFIKRVTTITTTYSLNQLLLKTTAPGIPDVYQGCELWDLSYVDPDNRRPVDYTRRKALLYELQQQQEQQPATALAEWVSYHDETGMQKLFVTQKILELRKAASLLFIKGAYLPLYAPGDETSVIAYLRHYENEWLLVVLPFRMILETITSLPLQLPVAAPKRWRNIFTGEEITGHHFNAVNLFKHFPVAVLEPV